MRKDLLFAIDDYHEKSLAMQRFLFEGNHEDITKEELKNKVDDDLIFHVPIYDMLDRKYAAFSSFLEAIAKKELDPKGNGKSFRNSAGMRDLELRDAIALFYLFRLCGSGINYVPKVNGNSPFGTHGFGNFWIITSMLEGKTTLKEWQEDLKTWQNPFTDSKGYLLPMISYKGVNGGHFKKFILEQTDTIVDSILGICEKGNTPIKNVVDKINDVLWMTGFKKQNFVMSATAADIAEYFPDMVDRNSMIYAGTNARKCIKAIFGKCKEEDAIQLLSDRYNAPPYSVEDSRLCDVYRYFFEFQSKDHIAANRGQIFENNSVLKLMYNEREYKNFLKTLE